MTDGHPRIEIPAQLKPGDGRFGSGPSLVPGPAIRALAATGTGYLGTSHRRAGVKQVVASIRGGLRTLFRLPDGFEVVLGVGGATAFWDAAAFSIIERRSRHAVFGEFSAKFASVVASTPHLQEPDVVEAPPGRRPDFGAADGIDTYALTHNETSTGVMMPVVRPAATGLVVVDATSAAGAIPVDPVAFDVYYFSPQKVFASDGGLWIALCSPAAISRIGAIAAGGRAVPAFLDLQLAVTNSRQDQTYNTPALATLFLLDRQITTLNDGGGLDAAAARSAKSSQHLYTWAEASSFAAPFITQPGDRSPTVVTIDLDGLDAGTVAAVMRANGIVDIEGYRKLGRNQLRIATFPAIDPADVQALTACLDYVAGELGSAR